MKIYSKYLGRVAMLCFIMAGFMVSPVAGFVVLGAFAILFGIGFAAIEMSGMKESKFYTIKAPDGHLIHTMVSLDEESAIAECLDTEITLHPIVMAGAIIHNAPLPPEPTWDLMLKQGYSVAPCTLMEVE